jgi:hypothetical protein
MTFACCIKPCCLAVANTEPWPSVSIVTKFLQLHRGIATIAGFLAPFWPPASIYAGAKRIYPVVAQPLLLDFERLLKSRDFSSFFCTSCLSLLFEFTHPSQLVVTPYATQHVFLHINDFYVISPNIRCLGEGALPLAHPLGYRPRVPKILRSL